MTTADNLSADNSKGDDGLGSSGRTLTHASRRAPHRAASARERWDNDPTSAALHFAGAGLAVAGLVLMIVYAAMYGTAWHVVAFSVFGATMISLYAASAAFHFAPRQKAIRERLRRIDHSMIYILIAGSYTPICLIPLRGGWGWSIFGVVWGLAIAGVLYKLLVRDFSKVISTIMYLAMGWIAMIAFVPLVEALAGGAFWWLIAGGLLYSVGTVFLGLDLIMPRKRWFGMHEIWHVFVMAGSFCHWWLMFRYILYL